MEYVGGVFDVPVTTGTSSVACLPPVVAVTVIVLTVESPAVDSVAVAAPLSSVVAGDPAMPPEVAVKATVTLGIKLLLASRTSAVMVALVDPSVGMLGTSLVSVTDATATVEPPLPLPLPFSNAL